MPPRFSGIKRVCTTEAAHTEKRKPRLSPNKIQEMTGFPIQQLDGICVFTKFT